MNTIVRYTPNFMTAQISLFESRSQRNADRLVMINYNFTRFLIESMLTQDVSLYSHVLCDYNTFLFRFLFNRFQGDLLVVKMIGYLL